MQGVLGLPSLKQYTVFVRVSTFRTNVLLVFSTLRVEVLCAYETVVFTRLHGVIKLTKYENYLQNGKCSSFMCSS